MIPTIDQLIVDALIRENARLGFGNLSSAFVTIVWDFII